jgi:hypothetical protein
VYPTDTVWEPALWLSHQEVVPVRGHMYRLGSSCVVKQQQVFPVCRHSHGLGACWWFLPHTFKKKKHYWSPSSTCGIQQVSQGVHVWQHCWPMLA